MEQKDVTRVCKQCGKELDIDKFHKTAWGYTHVCKECVKENRQKNKVDRSMLEDAERRIKEARNMRLQDFTPRELGEELRRRGFDGVLKYTETKTMDLSKLNQ